MTTQFWLMLLLYLLGVHIAFAFRRNIPLPFIVITGLLWGSLAWVIIAVLQLLTIGYTLVGSLVAVAVLSAGIAFIGIRRGAYRELSGRTWAWLIGGVVVFSLFNLLAQTLNVSSSTPDTLFIIAYGRTLPDHRFVDTSAIHLSLWGVYLYVMQSIAVWTQDAYLHSLGMLMSFTYVLSTLFLGFRIAYNLTHRRILSGVAAILMTALMFSSYLIVFHIGLLLSNPYAALTLTLGLGCIWLANMEQNTSWLFFGLAGLLLFSLTRVETSAFTILFVMVWAWRFSYSIRLRWFAPFLGILAVWHLIILSLLGFGERPRLLATRFDSNEILLLVAMAVGGIILLYVSRWRRIERLDPIHPPIADRGYAGGDCRSVYPATHFDANQHFVVLHQPFHC